MSNTTSTALMLNSFSEPLSSTISGDPCGHDLAIPVHLEQPPLSDEVGLAILEISTIRSAIKPVRDHELWLMKSAGCLEGTIRSSTIVHMLPSKGAAVILAGPWPLSAVDSTARRQAHGPSQAVGQGSADKSATRTLHLEAGKALTTSPG